MIKPASRFGQVEEYYFSRKLREIAQMNAEGKNVINLGIGSPDLAPAKEVIQVLNERSRMEGNHAYQSYVGIPELRKAFSGWYKKYFNVDLNPVNEVLPLIGSKEGIMHISMTYLEAGDEVLVPNPGYPAYAAVAKLTGANIRNYELRPESGWLPDLDVLRESDLSRVKLMWINYPNMPTGTQASFTFFESLIRFAREHQILICNDNPYAFILNEKPQSILAIPGAKEVALELNSLSKAHNMAGWRVGMIGGKANYLSDVLKFKSNMDSGMFRPIQEAAVRALAQPKNWYEELNKIYQKRRNVVFSLLDRLDCTYQQDQVGMFVWAAIPDVYQDAYALSDRVLYDHNVFVTPGGIFGTQGNKYVRISLCSKLGQLEEAMERLQDF